MENENWKIEYTWIKAHAGHRGNKVADQIAKEAATNSNVECCNRIPKNTVKKELSNNNVTKCQSEWDNRTKCAITKSFFPEIAGGLK